ncbi:hypothetical protein QYE76_069231 [Lolium multiflorum]|uniref:RNase H type-1 domain-containing protein n=1 Tax=Lolium multiflorum TaxID=4521 RepID=A0AAD8SFW9_LOLMU|nr:hypothetical protein QYE76_069231 [Lolium multiflorum]
MATTVLCQICGQEAEDTYHVFMRFPHARSLWLAMKEVWELPSDELMKQQELNGSSSYSLASRRTSGFLISYLESLFLIKQHPTGDIAKGKMVVDSYAGFKARTIQQADRRKERKHWRVPDIGYMKLNTDGSFVSSREAGMGMVLRDHHGVVVVAACREAIQCRDATDAELMAIEEGVHLALLWTTLPIVVSVSDIGSDEEDQHTKARQVLLRLQVGQFTSYFAKVNVYAFRAKHKALDIHLRNFQRVEIAAGRMPPIKPKVPKIKGQGSKNWRKQM